MEAMVLFNMMAEFERKLKFERKSNLKIHFRNGKSLRLQKA